jgi:hypothetical protein
MFTGVGQAKSIASTAHSANSPQQINFVFMEMLKPSLDADSLYFPVALFPHLG